ncbi:MAG: tRNA (cytidine(34)-2'-O)-methyltransferase [Erysipelothrix sp.]|nr:tRNA (cytidine(34)-2'-O)-methyltransferase [Erysipelothrix sp.]
MANKDKVVHIVLFEPEIPANTGNIMRTCVAAKMVLHLIEPLGFILDDRHLKRSGLDYLEDLEFIVHDDLNAFYETMDGICYYISRYGQNTYSDVNYMETDSDVYLMFGKESTGIPLEVLQKHQNRVLRIPMNPDSRSLNLSNCVAIVGYEVLRQKGFSGLSQSEVQKGANWLNEFNHID